MGKIGDLGELKVKSQKSKVIEDLLNVFLNLELFIFDF